MFRIYLKTPMQCKDEQMAMRCGKSVNAQN